MDYFDSVNYKPNLIEWPDRNHFNAYTN